MPSLLLVHLQHSVREYDLQDHQKKRLSKTYPNHVIHFAADPQDFQNRIPDAQIILTWNFRKEWYASAKLLEAIHTPSAGHDWVDEDPSGKVKVTYGSFHGKIISQTVLARILQFNRRTDFNRHNQTQAEWIREFPVSPVLLDSQTISIIGYGAIGQFLARDLKHFGCKVFGIRRNASHIPDHLACDAIFPLTESGPIIKKSDHVISILPGYDENRKILGKSFFEQMKPSAYFHSVGRGTCVDEDALLEIVRQKRISGAYLDVFQQEPLPIDSPLWHTEGIHISPHVSASDVTYLDLFLDELEARSKVAGN